jgi:coenzyme F420-0:L-glutamate ligase/coenzyme F420-1:gamma-L-glutamate ligase
MFVQSLGAALQNLLLAAVERGLAGYLKGAPLFCQEAIREALRLPAEWEPAFLVQLGYAAEGFEPPTRETIDVAEFVVER